MLARECTPTTKLDRKTEDQLVPCRRIMRTVNAQSLMLHDVRAQKERKKAGKVYTQYNGMVQIIIELLIWMRDHGIRRRERGGGGGAIQQRRRSGR